MKTTENHPALVFRMALVIRSFRNPSNPISPLTPTDGPDRRGGVWYHFPDRDVVNVLRETLGEVGQGGHGQHIA